MSAPDAAIGSNQLQSAEKRPPISSGTTNVSQPLASASTITAFWRSVVVDTFVCFFLTVFLNQSSLKTRKAIAGSVVVLI